MRFRVSALLARRGPGSDIALFTGSRSQYSVTRMFDSSFRVGDQRVGSPFDGTEWGDWDP
jgi:hypothetical protein